MDSLDTAEKVTRFLRGKDVSPDHVCETVRGLFSGSIKVYLPNYTYFAFDLVCDRLNDFTGKNFKQWKYYAEIWYIFSHVWRALENSVDRDVRARSFKRVKLISIISTVLEECTTKYNDELLTAMFDSVELIMSTGYVDVDEYSAVGMLKAYADLVLVAETQSTQYELVNHWSTIVSTIFSIPHQMVSYKPTKKSTARFFSEPLPVILNLLASRKIEALNPTYDTLHVQMALGVFGNVSLSSHLDQITSSVLNAEGAEYFFQEVITNLASKDITLCEAVYVKIISEFPGLAEKLLDVLAHINRTLSSSFFLLIYESEMAKPTQNWKLIGNIVGLDLDLALTKWENVVDATKKIPYDEGVALAEKLASGFVKARDFSNFMKNVYPVAHTKASVWKSERVVSILSPKVNELSGNQISVLVEHFMNTKEKYSLTLILKGLLFCPLPKQQSIQLLFVDYNFCQPGWSEIAYYVLCIYGESILETQPEILLHVGSKSTKYDLYLNLRIAELSNNTALVNEKTCNDFLKKADTEQLVLFTERWLVLIDSFPEIHNVLFEKMLKLLDQNQMLSFFTAHGDVIYELSGFMVSFLRALRNVSISYRDNLFCCFPPSIFRKYFGYYLNIIAKDAIADPENSLARVTLKHILQEPTFSSDIEKDAGLLRQLLNTTNSDTRSISLDIAKDIWNAHLNNFKDAASSKFVLDAYKSTRKTMKKPTSGDLALAQVILRIPLKSSDADKCHLELCQAFVTAIKKLKLTVEEQLMALSDISIDVSEEVLRTIRAMTKEMGLQASSEKNRALLFALVVKSALATESNALFITSLYVAINNKDGDTYAEVMLEHLRNYYTKLPNTVYDAIYNYVLRSMETAPNSYVPYLVDILSVLAPTLTKTYQEEHTKLFVATVLSVMLKRNIVVHPRTLLRFLATITRMLSDHIWICTQYVVELTLSLGDSIVNDLVASKDEDIYTSVVRMVSYVVLFHRYRLSSRYHLVVGITSKLMLPLACTKALGSSHKAAAAYSRLLIALAEPAVQGSTKENDALTSQAAMYKKLLRKHAHVLLVNYVHLQLTNVMATAITDAVLPGIYSVIGLLSRTELQLTNQCLDSLGKIYFKKLYGGYRDHGKWKDQ